MKTLLNFLQCSFCIFVFVAFSGILASGAERPETVSAEIGKDVGKYIFELHKIGKGTYGRWREVKAEIRIKKNGYSEFSQRLPVVIGIPSPSFDITDINGDGYKDLLLYDTCAGYAGCAGPTTAADVFLYIPTLKKFVKSKTLSGRGDITISNNRWCVNVNYKCSDQDYIDEEWCFNLSTGKWKMINSTGCELQ